MVARIGKSLLSLIVVGSLSAADAAAQDASAPANRPAESDSTRSAGAPAAQRSSLGRAEAMIMLDYQVIPIAQAPSLDLMGFHVLGRVSDSIYLGIGALAPLVRGDYGGFMAVDVTAHAQRRIWRNLFADAGVSLGGGGGGKSKEQSPVLSGTGGFAKGYAGLGWDFGDFSLGANVARTKFRNSAIDSTRLDVFLQVPFSYTVGSYADAGQRLSASDTEAAIRDTSENTLSLGVDNLFQIDPQGSNKSTIGLVDLQYAHYLTPSAYWYASVGVGYRGLRLYNQVIGGAGWRWHAAPRLDLHAQLGVGSGGWAPDRIDTGSGLLVYPKVSAEVAISSHFGLGLSAGYLFAPTGSSKNGTLGAWLSYHVQDGRERTGDATLAGWRFNVFEQTEYNVRVDGAAHDAIRMVSAQLDAIVGEHVFVPVQISAAYNAYLGYPGYGEILAGIGVHNRYDKGDRFQFFAQLLGGTNVHGPVVKPGIGVNLGLTDQLAVYATLGATRTVGSQNVDFRSDYAGLGLTYRFSTPSW